MGRTNRGGVAGGEGEGEEVHSRRRRRQQGGELGDGVADLLRDGLRGVGLERGEEVRLERGLAGGGELRPRGGRGATGRSPLRGVPEEAAGDAPSAPAKGGDGRRLQGKKRDTNRKEKGGLGFLVGPNVYQAESRHGAWRD